jgi:hypothetical protein
LVALVKKQLKEVPFSYDGDEWAAKSQEWWSKKAGVSDRTLRTMLKGKPFVTTRAHVNGVVCCLIRLGSKGPPSEKDLQKELSKIWRNRNYWPDDNGVPRVSPYLFGCLCGLVEIWGREAPKVFAWILDHWSDFMLMIKAEKDSPNNFLAKPSIPVIRKFADVAYEMYENANAD